MSRLPSIHSDLDNWDTIMNDFLAQGINADGKLKSRKILNMAATPYNVSSVASVTANANNINQAMHDASIFSDAAGVFLPGGPKIPSNGLILPSEPILFLGDGSGNSFIHFAANQQGLGYVNTVGSARWGDGFTYEPVWIIQGITFEGSYSGANWGWNFPNWSSPSGTALNMLARDVKVTYFAGGGINYQIGGIGPDGSFENIEVAHIGGDACFKLGSDFRGSNLDAHSADYEAYYWDNGRNTQLQLIKGWDVGKAHVAGRSAGMHMAGGGQTITNAYMQDCYGPSVYAVNCDGLTIGELVSDRNNWDATDGTSALVVENSHNIQIDNYRNIKTANTQTQYSLKVLDSGSNNYSNRISMVHDTNGGFSMTGAVDPASNLSGTQLVVGGSGGGQYVVAFSSAITPDVSVAQTWVIGALTAGITINAPTNPFRGARLRLRFLQDATGNRVVTLNAIFKNAFVQAGASSGGKQTIAEFENDGTNWIQIGTNVWF